MFSSGLIRAAADDDGDNDDDYYLKSPVELVRDNV